MTFERILVPFDGSSCAENAFFVALDVAKRFNAKMYALEVVYAGYAGHPYFDTWEEKGLLKAGRSQAQKQFENLKKYAKKADVSVTYEIAEGVSTVDTIIRYANSHKIDMIVIGSRGMSGFKKMLLGSASSGVSQYAKVPVLIVK